MLKRFLLITLVAFGVLAIAGTASAVQPTATPSPALPDGGCAAFGRTQTYQAWGPAAYYDRPVEVAYAIADCSATLTGLTFDMTATGTATISDIETGEAIESRPFTITGSWADPLAPGWPLNWWACDVESASLSWTIEGAYAFIAEATSGSWAIDIVVPGADNIHFEYSGC